MTHRSLSELSGQAFDVVVVGGGSSGAAAAREAALRGLKTALVEKGDFGEGASTHCFKMVHGGIRYLQHADIGRLRKSCFERATMLRIAPHLVSPLPIAIPTYGWGRHGKPFLGTGMLVYDALSADRNKTLPDRARQIPGTRFLSPSEILAEFPDLKRKGLTGAAVFNDGQMYSTSRLVWAFVDAARAAGAVVANYAEAERMLTRNGRVVGMIVRDRLTDQRFEVQARVVINASGPWAEDLLESAGVDPGRYRGTYSRDTCFVIDRRYSSPLALAIQGESADSDAIVGRGARHMFLVPWRDKTLVGVWHRVVDRRPDDIDLPDDQLQSFIDEMNSILPSIALTRNDVRITGFGLVPFGEHQAGGATLSFGKESKVIDHAARDGVEGLVTVISVRYTVARKDANDALDLAIRRYGLQARPSNSELAPLPGGDIDDFNALLAAAKSGAPRWLPTAGVEALVRNYGTHYPRILKLAADEPALARCVAGTHASLAEVAYVCRQEMAVTLGDVLFRRTEIATSEAPQPAAVAEVERVMREELALDERELERQRGWVSSHLLRYRASVRPTTSSALAGAA
jgi:glycerol-3-phosphate dehydrogenase